MLFLDDGVFQLLGDQQPGVLELKDLGANLKALPLFGVSALFACASSLRTRGIDPDVLALEVSLLAPEDLPPLLNRFDEVITL
jgi:tRNA 2-thiouridine synthesizing protein C